MRHATNAYQTVRRVSLVENKSPHELTLMLFDGALNEIAHARHLMDGSSPDRRRAALSKAIAIAQELQGTLKDTETVELAGNLFALYGFVISQLLEANRRADSSALDNAESVLTTLREAWVSIEPMPVAA